FGAALALAAYLSMPHQSVPTLSAGVGLVGLGGLSYGGLVAARLRRQGSRYVPVREDWIWNAILPMSAYGGLTASAGLLWHRLRAAAPGRSGSVRLKLGQRFAVGMLVWAAACGAAVGAAQAETDASFLLTATPKDFAAYFPSYLANGYLSTMTGPRGTEGDL